MDNSSYQLKRGQLEEYFDRTASAAWARLTSDAPVSGIRKTVRAGRDRMPAVAPVHSPSSWRVVAQTSLRLICRLR